jgi:hypothetical protein
MDCIRQFVEIMTRHGEHDATERHLVNVMHDNLRRRCYSSTNGG